MWFHHLEAFAAAIAKVRNQVSVSSLLLYGRECFTGNWNTYNITHFALYSDCTSSIIVYRACHRNGQRFVEQPLRACLHCINSGIQCVKLIVLVWSADYEASNKQAMLQLLKGKKDRPILQELQFLLPIPEVTNVAKRLKGSLANWFLLGRERFNLSNMRTL